MSNIRTLEKHPYIGVRGSPERGYFVPACVGSGRWADFERCSRIHACGFRCFEGQFAFWGGICKSRPEPIGVRDFWGFWDVFKDFGPSWENQRGKTHVRCSLFPHIAILFRNAPNIKCHRLPLTNTRHLSGKSYPQQVSSDGSLVRHNSVQNASMRWHLLRVRLSR